MVTVWTTPDFRQVWQLIKNRLGKLRRQAFVISVGASKQSIQKFERRGVKVINIPSNSKKTYEQILEEVFDEIKDFWNKELPSLSTVTDENTKIQLSINAESYSRLCFFSVPLKYISIYKKYIFPIVQNYNFVPITVDEFIQSSNNLLATNSSLIEKASIVVVDISSNVMRNELGMILNSKKRKEKIIIITDNNDFLPSELYNINTLIRPENFLEDVDDFVYAFEKYFSEVANNTQERINGEARRLLEKHEYVAAVIAAVTLFEDVLRNELDKKIDKSSNVYSLTHLLRLANERQLINQNQVSELREWIMIRNKFVHTTDRLMNRHLATKIITSIEQAIQHIRNQ